MPANYYTSGGTQYVSNYQLPNGTYYSGPVSGIPKPPVSPTTGKTAVTLGNGQTVYVDNQGNFSDAQGNPVSNETVKTSTYKPAVSNQPAGGTTNTSTSAGSVTTGGVTVDVTRTTTTSAFKDTAAYKALPQDMKDFVNIAYNLIEVGGEAEAKMFANAIAQAQAVADPYFKTQLSLARAEVLGSIAEKNFDYEAKAEVVQRARDELMQDVASGKEFLSLEQQAEIAREVKAYDEDLLSIADQAAEKGITFATGARSRSLAESRRATQYEDVVQSTNRQANFKKKELEMRASRGDIAAQKELATLAGGKMFDLQNIGRAAEQVLGTANTPAIEGFTPVGGATGKIEEDKRKAILSDVAGFATLQKGFV